MTDSNLIPQEEDKENTVPEGAFGIGSKETDDFSRNEKLRNTGIKDIPRVLREKLFEQSSAVLFDTQIKKKQIEESKEIIEVGDSAVRGTMAGLGGIVNEGRNIYDYVAGNPYNPQPVIDLKELGIEQEDSDQDFTYQAFKFGSQWLLPYSGLNIGLKGIAGIKMVKGLGMGNTFIRSFTAGAATDFIAWDAFDENLFNTAQEVLPESYLDPIFEYLDAPKLEDAQGNEERTRALYAQGKLNRLIEGGIFGEGIALVGKGAGFVSGKGIQTLVDATMSADEKIAAQTLKGLNVFEHIKNDPKRLEAFRKWKNKLDRKILKNTRKLDPEFEAWARSSDDSFTTPEPKVKSKTKKSGKPIQPRTSENVWVGSSQEDMDRYKALLRAEMENPKYPTSIDDDTAIALGEEYLTPELKRRARFLANQLRPENDKGALRVVYRKMMNTQIQVTEAIGDTTRRVEEAIISGNTELKDELLDELATAYHNWHEIAIPTKIIGSESAATVRINRFAKNTPSERIPLDEEIKQKWSTKKRNIDAKIGRKTTREIVEDAAKESADKAAMPTKEEIFEALKKARDNNDIEQLLGVTRKIQAMQGDPQKLTKLFEHGGILKQVGKGAAKTLDITNEIFINSILSAPETHLVNVFGSLINAALRPTDLILGSGFEKESTIRGLREYLFMMSSSMDSLKMAGKAVWLDKNILDERRVFGLDDAGKAKSPYAISFHGDSMAEKIIYAPLNLAGHVVRIPRRFMLGGDEFVKNIVFRSGLLAEIAMEADRAGLVGQSRKIYINSKYNEILDIVNKKSVLPEQFRSANTLDSYLTHLDNSADATFTQELGHGFNFLGNEFGASQSKAMVKILTSAGMKPITPFVTTPINIGKHVLRRTGISIPGAGPKANASLGRILKEHNDRFYHADKAVRYRAQGEAITGGLIWGFFLMHALAARDPEAEIAIIGGGHANKWRRQSEERTGELGYSLRLIQKDVDGNTIRGADGMPKYEYLDILDRLEPIASMLMIAGDFVDLSEHLTEEEREEAAWAYTALINRNIKNKYMLQSVSNAIEGFSNPQSFLKIPAGYISAIRNYPTSLRKSVERSRGKEWTANIGMSQKEKTFQGNFKTQKYKMRKGDLIKQRFRDDADMSYINPEVGTLTDESQGVGENLLDTLGLMINRELADGKPGFSADVEPILSPTTGKVLRHPSGWGINPFNPLKSGMSANNPIDTFIRRSKALLREPSDVLMQDDTGDGIKLDTPQYTKFYNLIAFVKPTDKKGKPIKGAKRLPEVLYEMSQSKNFAGTGLSTEQLLTIIESDNDTLIEQGSPDTQSALKLKKKYTNLIKSEVYRVYNAYIDLAEDYYEENIMDQKVRKARQNEMYRSTLEAIQTLAN